MVGWTHVVIDKLWWLSVFVDFSDHLVDASLGVAVGSSVAVTATALAMATLCVSLPSTVVGYRASDRGQFTSRRLEGRFGSSPLGRRFQGGVSKQVKVKVWTVRASLEVRTRFGAAESVTKCRNVILVQKMSKH